MDLFGTPCNAALLQVIWRHLHCYLITWKDSNEVHTKFSRDVSQNYVAVWQLNFKLSVWQSFQNLAFNFDYVFLGQVKNLLLRFLEGLYLTKTQTGQSFSELFVGCELEKIQCVTGVFQMFLLFPFWMIELAPSSIGKQHTVCIGLDHHKKSVLISAGNRPDDGSCLDHRSSHSVMMTGPEAVMAMVCSK